MYVQKKFLCIDTFTLRSLLFVNCFFVYMNHFYSPLCCLVLSAAVACLSFNCCHACLLLDMSVFKRLIISSSLFLLVVCVFSFFFPLFPFSFFSQKSAHLVFIHVVFSVATIDEDDRRSMTAASTPLFPLISFSKSY